MEKIFMPEIISKSHIKSILNFNKGFLLNSFNNWTCSVSILGMECAYVELFINFC